MILFSSTLLMRNAEMRVDYIYAVTNSRDRRC
jgi:hypothetical protein